MTHIQVTKGLDIPIMGKPSGSVRPLTLAGNGSLAGHPKTLSLNLRAFLSMKFRLLVKVGDSVTIGQPLVEDKAISSRIFVSPAAGIITEIRRGLKRVLLDIVIAVADKEENYPSEASDELKERLLKNGFFAYLKERPFDRLANPNKKPKAIFIKAVDTAPFSPPQELFVEGLEKEFQAGLDALKKLTEGKVHLVCQKDTASKAFSHAKGVEIHTVEGPHPAGNVSLHIQKIDPIGSSSECVWTIAACDVVKIGYFLLHGHHHVEDIVGIGGPGIISNRIGFFKIRQGFPISLLVAGRIGADPVRLISGDPLMGTEVTEGDFLGFYDHVFCAIPENQEREFLHFFRLGFDKYSFSKAYASGHLDHAERRYPFTTNQHGEHRAFIDSSLYDKVMPLHIPTMPLVKAVMAEDLDLAEILGLLEVAPEDFALPAFVCPSKIEMPEIIQDGLHKMAKEMD